MKNTQIAEIVNAWTGEILGESAVLNDDLSNVVDIGTATLPYIEENFDHATKALINQVGKVVFVNRKYSGGAPSVMMEGWEYGSVKMKISAELPKATENETWELQDGASYDENIYTKPEISVKFFNKRVTFEVPISITDYQMRESFQSAEQLNAFVSMIFNAIDRSMTIKLDSLIMRTINNFTAETLHDAYPGGVYTGLGNARAINMLKLYNDKFNKSLTYDEAITDMDFLKYASYIIGLTCDRLHKVSKLYNIGGKDRFTAPDMLKLVMLSDFARAADTYLQSDTFHDEFTALPNADVVSCWQGTGTDYALSSTSKIDVKTASNNTVSTAGILAVAFDREALGVCNMHRRTTSKYNAKAEFTNSWFKMDSEYFNDFNENFVVFFAA